MGLNVHRAVAVRGIGVEIAVVRDIEAETAVQDKATGAAAVQDTGIVGSDMETATVAQDMETEAAVQGMETETAVQGMAIVTIRRADLDLGGAAGEDVHSLAETMRGKAVAAEGPYCRHHPGEECCRTGRVEQVSRRTEHNPGCSRDPTWFRKVRRWVVRRNRWRGKGIRERQNKKQSKRKKEKKLKKL
jgi:hypothetical protein